MRLNSLTSSIAIASALIGWTTIPAIAQEDDPSQSADTAPQTPVYDEDTIVVFGARLLGRVDAPQKPILELEAEDIAAYGVGSIGDLLEALGPSVTTGRGRGSGGRPIVLVNGVRVASFRDIRSYPPEAIVKVEVFSEEVAQQYGYSPDQRVINFILKENFSSRELEIGYGQPTDGGYSEQEIEATYLLVNSGRRLNFNVDYEPNTALTEADRGILQVEGPELRLPSDPDPARFRTLVPDRTSLEATANLSIPLGDDDSTLGLNATYERDESLRLQGLDTVLLTDPAGNSVLRTFNEADPLSVDNKQDLFALGASFTTSVDAWRVTATADAQRTDSVSLIQSRADTDDLISDAAAGLLALDASLDGLVSDAGFDRADTSTTSIDSLVTVRGFPLELPAGDVALTLDAGYQWNRIESADTRNAGVETQLTRGRLSSGANVTIPLTERGGFGGALGDLTLNASVGVDDLSDFGTLFDWTLGATWGVTDRLSFTINRIQAEAAPSLSQLGSPEIQTFNVSVFDFINNETVLATVITGGNPNLPAQTQKDWKAGFNWELPIMENARFTADYIRNTSNDVASGFPVLTPAIEAAFPDRVFRDGAGTLLTLDRRPVTYAEQFTERLEFAIDLRGNLGSDERSGGRFGGRRGGGSAGGGGGGGDGGGRPPSTGGNDAAPADGPARPPVAAGRDPEEIARMRAAFCEAPPETLLAQFNAAAAAAARGEELPPGPDGQAMQIPPQMLQRLMADDGTIDPELFAAMRSRICDEDGAAAEGGDGASDAGEGTRTRGGQADAPTGSTSGRPGGGRGGRWFFNVRYTHELQNELLIAPGVPVLDLLGGDAVADGGQARDVVQLGGGAFFDGYGVRVSGNYKGASKINGDGQAGSTDLRFGELATLDLRLFVDLEQRERLMAISPFFKGMRVSLRLDNVFDSRQSVTESDGTVPINYQPFLLDPVGRRFEIELRKLF